MQELLFEHRCDPNDIAIAKHTDNVRNVFRSTALLDTIQSAHAFERADTEKPAPISMGPNFFLDAGGQSESENVATIHPAANVTQINVVTQSKLRKTGMSGEISQVLSDRFTVNGFITMETPLAGYARATRGERIRALKGITFMRTWCKVLPSCAQGAKTKTKASQPPFHQHILKERRSTCGSGGSRSEKLISCC
jgi:hypothetical protein